MTAATPALNGGFGQGPNALLLPGTPALAGPIVDVTGGFDLRFRLQISAATPFGTFQIGTGATVVVLVQNNANTVTVNIYNAAGAVGVASAFTAAQLGNPAIGDWVTVRAVYNAATGQIVRYLSTDNGTTWTEVATQSVTPFVVQPAAGAIVNANGVRTFAWLDLRTFDGTPIASADFTWVWDGTTFVDLQHNTWTLHGTGWAWQGPPAITTTALPPATVGEPYTGRLTAVAGTPPYTWSITEGSLPAGLTLDPATGEITGTPL